MCAKPGLLFRFCALMMRQKHGFIFRLNYQVVCEPIAPTSSTI
jgi:hypothetical protein